MDGKILLSSSEFKALASDTRAGIIKLLRTRNHTLTEMSKKLNLAAPTVKQHLGVLQGAELIQELDEGRKWKYYSLTRKGKNMFTTETPVNVLIVLGVSIFALVGMVYYFAMLTGMQTAMVVQDDFARAPAFIESAEKVIGGSSAVASDSVVSTASEGATTLAPEALPVMSNVIPAVMQFGGETIVFMLAIVALALLVGYLIAKVRD